MKTIEQQYKEQHKINRKTIEQQNETHQKNNRKSL